MAHGDAREGKWRGNWQMEWVASTLHTTSEHGVFSITTADAHTSAASSWLNWRPRRFKWTRPFRRKTKSGFCTCAITFQLASTYLKVLSGMSKWRNNSAQLNNNKGGRRRASRPINKRMQTKLRLGVNSHWDRKKNASHRWGRVSSSLRTEFIVSDKESGPTKLWWTLKGLTHKYACDSWILCVVLW